MPTLNYTTAVPVTQSVGECMSALAAAGASHVAVAYEDGAPAGIGFDLRTPHGVRSFTLPVDAHAVRVLLLKQEADGAFRNARKAKGTFSSVEHAQKVAWRVVKDWLEAQLAMIEAHMATLDQVMLPYLHTDVTGTTLYEVYKAREQDALAAGSA